MGKSNEGDEMKPHKHCDLIKAWADGHEIQTFLKGEWVDEPLPCFFPDNEYRIKPRTVKNVGWVNIHRYAGEPTHTRAFIYANLDDAAKYKNCVGYIATAKIEWEEVE